MAEHSFLGQMARHSQARASALLQTKSLSQLRQDARLAGPGRPVDLGGFVLIGELKRCSPSEGSLESSGSTDACQRASMLESAGLSAISVLTEPTRFGGSLDDLSAVARTTTLPVMRKDFLVHPAQIFEARLHGASMVLLVAGIVDDDALEGLLDACAEAGVLPLLEAFDAAELHRAHLALEGRPGLLGLNCRDLRSLRVDPRRFASLAPRLPTGRRVIAESGLSSAGGIRRVVDLGYGGALVGSALMRSDDPAHLAARMARAARDASRRAA